ncbi:MULTISPECIES: proteasome-type protease [Aquaspirillum]|uniref:proteasome-type protease n=1 Tax=Aquaspirillum serpens TaxID=190 RepID=UPI0003B320DD|nr:proteasome-type protease [Aquaspirillum serpens]
MTYCVALRLNEGLVFASDSRTNAGVDHVATFRKMHRFAQAGERQIVLLNSGNLATTQSVISMLRSRCQHDAPHLLNVPSLYDAAVQVGQILREVIARDSVGGSGVDYGAHFLVGGQIAGERARLFHVYPQGNFIEATEDTPYFQIGESKYGKPILDRVLDTATPLEDAVKCVLISFDSTIRSNLSVGLPIDLFTLHEGDLHPAAPRRIDERDVYFQSLRRAWGQGLRRVFARLPPAPTSGIGTERDEKPGH